MINTEQSRSRAEVIVNAGAGGIRGADPAQELKRHFAAHGVEAGIHIARRSADVGDMARRAVKANPDTVVAGGGDGTMNAVASAVLGTGVPLGVLPLGTLNHFAKDLGVPLEIEAAVADVCHGRVASVDVGRVNGRLFLNNSSLGLYPRFVKGREVLRGDFGWSKWPAFAWAAVAVLRRSPFLRIRLRVDDEEITRRTPLVFVGNNAYELEGFNLGARSCLDAGYLSLYMINRTDRMALFALAARALFKRLRQAQDFDSFCVQRVEVTSRHKHMMVAIDGEVRELETPLVYHVEKSALSVIVPANI
jgi:diacylglycerol kinase family enzyme